ncbi:hypothetical protein V2J09_009617 [Rumex salicifolius]
MEPIPAAKKSKPSSTGTSCSASMNLDHWMQRPKIGGADFTADEWRGEKGSFDVSEKSLLLSYPSSLELEELTKCLDEEERDEPERNNATGFNIFIAGGNSQENKRMHLGEIVINLGVDFFTGVKGGVMNESSKNSRGSSPSM